MAKRHPQSVVDRAELLARCHTIPNVAIIMRLDLSTIYRFRARGWKACVRDPRLRPVPNDWAFTAPHMTVGELARHYKAREASVCRWLREKPVRALWKPNSRQAEQARMAA